ncbi:MAG: SMI1/KNR4 family protein [Verrucomicrobia bacterium]|nr:SMI1/KNR4 family protein [Verrucomicrobiota bacterium]
MRRETRPKELIICGHEISVQNIDSRMWDAEFKGLAKCPDCGFRIDFLATNQEYCPLRSGRDIGCTWDNAWIVSERFRQLCRRNELEGLEFRPLGRGDVFHAVPTRFVGVDPKHSPFEYDALCEKCGNPEWFVARGLPIVLKIAEPLTDGFWATEIFLGSENTKGPSIILNQRTLSVLKESGLNGAIQNEPVYAVRHPGLEAALMRVPKKKTVKASPEKAAPPSRLNLRPFIRLLSEAEPAFHCRVLRKQRPTRVIRIEHVVNVAPTEAQLTIGRQMLGRGGKLVYEFYTQRNGVDLYRGVGTDEVGLRLFPVNCWKFETAAMKKIFASMPKNERPEVLDRAVAFGEPPSTGHHFAIVTNGLGAGSILLTNHETLSADEFAPDFNEFLKIICTDPVDLLVNQLGCYVRYRDGRRPWNGFPKSISPMPAKHAEKRA